ncbi:hypothetical protein ACFLU5_10475 [Bacteroidota bacterium]
MNKQTMKTINLIIASCALCLSTSVLNAADIITLDNGDQISWDGSYYDFKDSNCVQMIKLWIPPNLETVKGLFISGHGGGGGDSRQFARDENVRAYATRLGFAVAGLHNFPGRQVYEKGAGVFFNALDEFAKLGHHPELSNVPYVIYGSSNGGSTVYGFINYAPERAICFVSNVSGGLNPEIPVDAALKVPGIFIIGKFDALTGARGLKTYTKLFEYASPKEALWSWAVELKGHEDGYSFDVYMKLVEQAVKLRYPEKEDPKKQPVKLKKLNRKDGWLVNFDTWDQGMVYTAPYKDYKNDKTKAGWVLNKDMAYVYRSMATHHNPISLSVKEFDRTLNTNTDPGTMYSLGGPVVNPGEEINISCDMSRFPGWEKLEIFNGSEKLGEVSSKNEPHFRISTSKNNLVYCLLAVATDNQGIERTSDPMHFFIRDPELIWKTDRKLTGYRGVKLNRGSKNDGKEINANAPDNRDSILVSYGLNADLETQFSSTDGKIAEFWDMIGEKHDYINMLQRKDAKRGAEFKRVLTHDCNMIVKSAYGGDGLYLLFEVNDDSDTAWPNKFNGTEKEQFYNHFDAVDFMIDSRSVKEICSAEGRKLFVSPHFSFTKTTMQYQAAFGNEIEQPEGLKVSTPDPWDMHAAFWTFEDLEKHKGIQIENIKTDYFFRAQEWFIPWSQINEALVEEPDANTRFALAAGFNDRDEGEHFPPGINSSGGSVKSSNSLRWINSAGPWAASPKKDKPPYNWGEIELGPMLGN